MFKLRPYSTVDFSVLERKNTPEQKQYVGGPESEEKLLARHKKYCDSQVSGKFEMFVIEVDGVPAGTVGYWEREWRGEKVYETGWGVFPEFQGRGLASGATVAMIDILKGVAHHRYLHAYPSPENEPSNRLCRKLGFVLVEECDFEYPPGSWVRANDWRYDLTLK